MTKYGKLKQLDPISSFAEFMYKAEKLGLTHTQTIAEEHNRVRIILVDDKTDDIYSVDCEDNYIGEAINPGARVYLDTLKQHTK